ncbi:MAG: zinc-ribbon domain containing protein [Deltaproteobacteria bacterium]|nr:zinc-ribbon domain containing protein [Deltaproteobacteria bacterium]MBN2688610.1 zinc-ribbon domain containing protein [Deltaproteobacteria bacterium]
MQCGTPFVFTWAEQERFLSRGFDSPRRCLDCRKKKSKLGNGNDEERGWMKKEKLTPRKRRPNTHDEVWP